MGTGTEQRRDAGCNANMCWVKAQSHGHEGSITNGRGGGQGAPKKPALYANVKCGGRRQYEWGSESRTRRTRLVAPVVRVHMCVYGVLNGIMCSMGIIWGWG